MKVNVENLEVGQTIGMLDGVVRVTVAPRVMGDRVRVGVSIGRLRDHAMHFPIGTQMNVYDVPASIAPWYGV